MKAARIINTSGFLDQRWESQLNSAGFDTVQFDFDSKLEWEGNEQNLQACFYQTASAPL